MKKCFFLLAFILVIGPGNLHAQSPKEVLKKQVDAIFQILKSETYKEADAETKKELLLEETEHFFHKEAIARMTLGRYWRQFSQEQQNDFIQLFSKLLEKNYFKKITDYSYENETVQYLDETIIGRKAIVKTKVITKDKEIPVEYSLINDNGWRAYDAKIEGISLVRNYRSQFNEYLNRNKPDDLLELLQKKIESEDEDDQ